VDAEVVLALARIARIAEVVVAKVAEVAVNHFHVKKLITMDEYVLIYPKAVNLKKELVLVRKNKPAWQKGKLNLPGGKIEAMEDYKTAALRELKEETGLEPVKIKRAVGENAKKTFIESPMEPTLMGKIIGSWGIVYCVKIPVLFKKLNPDKKETQTCQWFNWMNLRNNPDLLPNLNIIIPMMMFGVENWTLVDESPLVDNPEFFLLSGNQPSSFYITMFSKNDKYNDEDK
jgi:ADP-ribose pyrophosphatase YjhB (NUDIX family)